MTAAAGQHQRSRSRQPEKAEKDLRCSDRFAGARSRLRIALLVPREKTLPLRSRSKPSSRIGARRPRRRDRRPLEASECAARRWSAASPLLRAARVWLVRGSEDCRAAQLRFERSGNSASLFPAEGLVEQKRRRGARFRISRLASRSRPCFPTGAGFDDAGPARPGSWWFRPGSGDEAYQHLFHSTTAGSASHGNLAGGAGHRVGVLPRRPERCLAFSGGVPFRPWLASHTDRS